MDDIFRQCGPLLWLIVLAGVAAFAAFVERGFHLHRARIKSDDFMNGVLNILRAGNMEEALAICDETPGPVSQVVRAAILHSSGGGRAVESAVVNTGLSEISMLERGTGIIMTVAQVAPLLGLVGTVFGLMTMLGAMEGSQWQPAEVTIGLRNALAATAAGLLVAIPSYAAHNLIAGKIEGLVVDMERAASEITAFFSGCR